MNINVIQFVSAKHRGEDERWIREQISERLKRQLPMIDDGILAAASGFGVDQYRHHRSVDNAVQEAIDYAVRLEDQFLISFGAA